MTSVNVTSVENIVAVTATKNRVVIAEQPIKIAVNQQNNVVALSQITNQVVVAKLPAANTVEVQEPTGVNLVLQTSDISESTVLNITRLDASDTSLSYTNGQLTSVVRDGISKAITYNLDGTVNTVTITTNTDTQVKTFSYNQDGLVSITVT
ncbi:hypothetical protein [Limnobacter sp.]|uniref:hypothetical protein n=1 Tax=Limnobacter sp. TaxID=2003368 RepID=UPI0025BC9767|nr:hypothetical protein [Limnobacter sp.]